jgi:hypothetical protein
MTSTYEMIATTTLSSSQSSITFSSIPGTYTDLVLVCNVTKTASSNTAFRLNSDTGSNYSSTFLEGNGTTASSSRLTSTTQGSIDYSDTTVNPVPSITHFMNYSNTTTNKTTLSRSGSEYVYAYVNLWRNTAAINTILVYAASGNYVTGSIFTLYGIKAE